MKRFRIVLIVLAILILPSALYLLVTTGKHNFGNLPYYGPRDAVEVTDAKGKTKMDTIYHSIPAFEFTNQDGKPFGSKDLLGKVYVADFFFTTCPGICKRMGVLMQEVQKKVKADHRVDYKEFAIVSFSVKPEEDSVPVLKAYSQRLQADSTMWNFLTGDRKQIYELGQKGFMLNTTEDLSAPGGVLHSEKFMLIDKEGHIRGIYDGTNLAEINKLVEDVRVLFANYRLAKKVNNNEAPKLEQRR